jgi:hypothetical protein
MKPLSQEMAVLTAGGQESQGERLAQAEDRQYHQHDDYRADNPYDIVHG